MLSHLRVVLSLLLAFCACGCASWREQADARYQAARDRGVYEENTEDGWLFDRMSGRERNQPGGADAIASDIPEGSPTPPMANQATFDQPSELSGDLANSYPAGTYSAPRAEDLPGDSLENREPEPEGWERYTPDNISKQAKKAVGLGPDRRIARQHFDEGDRLFAAKQFKEAAAQYKKACNRWPDSGLEEDALYMQAESEFFANRYPAADEAYDELAKKYPNTRHLNKLVVRQFSIAHYWQKHHEADPHWAVRPNLTDRTRPWFDTSGHAMAAYDHVRLNDPRGPLADDATMATATAFFLKGRYEDADYYYTLLRKDYPKSEHQLEAHRFGLQAKLRMYQGSGYDVAPLVGAEELIDQMLVQFPNEPGEEQERLLLAKKEVRAQRARRDFDIAQFYDNSKHYDAARYYYAGIVKEYPQSSFADQSRERLARIQSEPGKPADRMAFLDEIFERDSIDRAIAAEARGDTVQR